MCLGTRAYRGAEEYEQTATPRCFGLARVERVLHTGWHVAGRRCPCFII
jgi:hypothetical protein